MVIKITRKTKCDYCGKEAECQTKSYIDDKRDDFEVLDICEGCQNE